MYALNYLKKIAVMAFAVLAISLVHIASVQAYDYREYYLRQILEVTQNILVKVNDLPTNLQNLVTLVGELKVNLLADDTSDNTAKLQQQFSLLGTLLAADSTPGNINQVQMMADILGVPVSELRGDKPVILQKVPNLNDLTYTTLLGQPPIPKAPANPADYIKYIAGTNIRHSIPSSTWQGEKDKQLDYWSYFNTVVSIESYNGYLLTKQFAKKDGGQNLTQTQTNLIKEASNSNWIQTIATQEIGKVLRQILMFESQTYVLLSRFMQGQQDLLTAQLMTNTLLILNNYQMEGMMAANAKGVRYEG